MGIRIIAVVVIMSSSFFYGFVIKFKHKLYNEELSDLIKCFEVIEHEICVCYKDIISAFGRAVQLSSEHNKILFETFLDIYKTSKGLPIFEIWNNAINISSGRLIYTDSELKYLLDFGVMLGNGNVSTQKKIFESLNHRLTQVMKERKANDVKNKTLSKLCIYFGLLITIIFF